MTMASQGFGFHSRHKRFDIEFIGAREVELLLRCGESLVHCGAVRQYVIRDDESHIHALIEYGRRSLAAFERRDLRFFHAHAAGYRNVLDPRVLAFASLSCAQDHQLPQFWIEVGLRE